MPTVVELRSELGKRKLPTDGLKSKLEQRLRDADQKVQKAGQREVVEEEVVEEVVEEEGGARRWWWWWRRWCRWRRRVDVGWMGWIFF